MHTLTLTEARPEGDFTHFTLNFEQIDPARIQQVITMLIAPPKRRRSDAGKPKPRPNGAPHNADPQLVEA